MQNQEQAWYFDRAVYYVSKAIVDQGKPVRNWRYDYLPVYCVSFMNFVMKGFEDSFRIDAALCDLKTLKPFTDKQRYIFIQTPLFDKKTPEECVDDFDKWMYNIINMPTMETMAFIKENPVFGKLDEVAAYATLSEDERRAYDNDLKAYRDWLGQMEFAEARGRAEGEAHGRAEGIAGMVKEMARQGLAIDLIASIAKMTIDKVKDIISSKD